MFYIMLQRMFRGLVEMDEEGIRSMVMEMDPDDATLWDCADEYTIVKSVCTSKDCSECQEREVSETFETGKCLEEFGWMKMSCYEDQSGTFQIIPQMCEEEYRARCKRGRDC